MFELIAQSSSSSSSHNARAGMLHTAHGSVATPIFMPVGTKASVKGLEAEQLQKVGVSMLLANCYHLMVTPSAEIIQSLGGLHSFMNWHKPILTDSGGFQIWSLSSLRKFQDGGVTFRSHRDGSLLSLTPEKVIEAQYLLDADISMVLDECPAWDTDEKTMRQSLKRTHDWAWRSMVQFTQKKREGYGLFAITQGGQHQQLRLESAAVLTKGDLFDGYAIGGLSVGESKEEMSEMLSLVAPVLPSSKPRYLMGVGRPIDILESVALGIDMFDCVLPTRNGRNGSVFTHEGERNLRQARYIEDKNPLDNQCSCPVCSNYTRGYLHHLMRNREMLGASLLSWHNIAFYQTFMAKMRESIISNKFETFYHHWRKKFGK